MTLNRPIRLPKPPRLTLSAQPELHRLVRALRRELADKDKDIEELRFELGERNMEVEALMKLIVSEQCARGN